MSMRCVIALLLLCLTPLLASAAPAVGLPIYTHSNDPTLPGTDTATNVTAPNCTDLSRSTGATHPSCWDTLGMNQYMQKWNYTAQACKKREIWSTCFLRLTYQKTGYDCSRLGSLNCTAPQLGGPITDPQIFYGAYNIYAVNSYLTTWSNALYALDSQNTMSELVRNLSVPGAPRLTPTSLLTAVISHYGLDAAADEALMDMLPDDPNKLDTSVTFYSTQVSVLLAELLLNLMSDRTMLGFLWFAKGGKMMSYTGESLKNLEASLAGRLPIGASTEASVTETAT